MEWSNPYNSFNSMKGLCYYPEYRKISFGNIPPAVEVSIDPSNLCNLNCSFCNSKAILCNREKERNMSFDLLKTIVQACSSWGSRGFCFAGGGEPLLNKNVAKILHYINWIEKDSAIITNGTCLNDEDIDAISKCCRWIGFSVDAGTNETYQKIKGINNKEIFDNVCKNIKKVAEQSLLSERKKPFDICFKFLFSPDNYKDIYIAAELAKSLGVTSFHLRPAASEGFPMLDPFKYTPEQVKEINDLMEEVRGLEGRGMKVYTIRHKFKEDFQRKNDFPKCIAYPLILQLSNDGWAYACVDSRSKPEMRLFPFSDRQSLDNGLYEYWGSAAHKEKMRNVDPGQCPRCILTEYQKQCEAVKNDDMCINFP